MAFPRVVLPLLLLMPMSGSAAQQAEPIRLVVQEGGREIGREEFTLQQSRARGASGTTLTASARYPANQPATELGAVLEWGPEWSIAKFQLEVESAEGTTVILAAGSGARLIVRTVAAGSESGRELPGGPDVVLLDDGVYSLYAAVADLATSAGRRLTAIFPRTGKRASFTARREAAGGGGGVRTNLSGDISGTLVTDAAGRLRRLELRDRNITVTRQE
ncbi:MAG: hypothetical protein H0V43_11660 [Gemmatimonadales bacterium]|nr:hypothetical protein [Gemmatimonadales bacterium]